MIVTLSSYSADTLALLARQHLVQQVLLISPYVCVIVALIGVALSLCATESNGLADYAAMAILLVCLYVIVLGDIAAVIILDVAHRPTVFRWTVFWASVLPIGVICSWGWLFAYPRCLKLSMRMIHWSWFDGRSSTNPWRSWNANSESTQRTDLKGFTGFLSNSGAACLRAFHPLDEDTTIDILKALSPPVLTGMSAVSLWAAHIVAPQAYRSYMLQGFLYGLPYVYIPLGVVGIALCAAASKSNGLASYGSCLVLVLCTFGVVLGGSCSIVMLDSGLILSILVEEMIVFLLIGAWGWMFAYPKVLNRALHLTICSCCARRINIQPVRYEGGRNCFVHGLKMARFLSGCFHLCLRTVRGWWTAGCATSAGGEFDLEAGAPGFELTPMAVTRSPEDAEQGAETDSMLVPGVVQLAR